MLLDDEDAAFMRKVIERMLREEPDLFEDERGARLAKAFDHLRTKLSALEEDVATSLSSEELRAICFLAERIVVRYPEHPAFVAAAQRILSHIPHAIRPQ